MFKNCVMPKFKDQNRKDPLLFNISNLKGQTVVKHQSEQFYFNSDQQNFNHLKNRRYILTGSDVIEYQNIKI